MKMVVGALPLSQARRIPDASDFVDSCPPSHMKDANGAPGAFQTTAGAEENSASG